MNSKQAGMSTEAKLLYQISKQLDRLIKINATKKSVATTTTTTTVV
jgi:hypothetical protein